MSFYYFYNKSILQFIENLIYKVYLIDGDNGISLFESTFKELKKNPR